VSAAVAIGGSGPLRLIPLGGVGEIGLNLLIVAYGGDAIAIDCGVMFPDKDMLGVDLVIPDTTVLGEFGDGFRAVFLTHGHEDHIGALPYVLRHRAVPVYGTPMTLALVREKLTEHGLLESVPLRRLAPGATVEIGPFRVEAVHVTHSIVDAVALAIRTPVGTIVHTGDFKLDETPLAGPPSNLQRFAELGDAGVLVLLSDSTNVEREGTTPSERDVGECLETIFRGRRGKVIVSTFASHVHRIQQVFDVSHRLGRRVALVGRSLGVNVALAMELGHLRVPPNTLVDLSRVSALAPDEVTIIATGSQAEPLSALARIAMNDHPMVKAGPGDTLVLSSRVIPGNERAVGNLINHFYRRGAAVITHRELPCHASGHASQEELRRMLALTRPRHFVPVHGEYRHLVRHARLAHEAGVPEASCFLLENGEVLGLDDRAAAMRGTPVRAGRVFVDGKGVGDVGEVVLRDRRHLSADGFVLAVLAVDQRSGDVLAGPDLVSRGVLLDNGHADHLQQARAAVLEALAAINPESRTDSDEVKEEMRKALRRYFNRALGRRPVVLPYVVEM
jgi:ribonuclease J